MVNSACCGIVHIIILEMVNAKTIMTSTQKTQLKETYSTIQNYYRRNQMSKGKDISTMYTKEENKKNGRFGYGLATREKEDVISPAQYGAFLQKRGRRK